MVKVASRDILDILRRFELADENNVPRNIENIKISHPIPSNTLVSFSFLKKQFYIVFDDSAEDDVDYVMSQIRPLKGDLSGQMVKNPKDTTLTYAMPFRGKECYLFEELSGKKRLDVELSARYPDNSRSVWQKYIKSGYVSVNGVIAKNAKQEVSGIDRIAINLPDKPDFSSFQIPIVYIDDNVIVIDKPSGILTHSKGVLSDEFTVADFFRRYTTFGADTNRPGIIHRLDRDTSGVLIGARNDETATLLQKQFANRKTNKTYFAIVDGTPKLDKAVIDLPIGRNPSKPSTFRVDSKGKSAQTKYEVLESNNGLSLVKLSPQTGRTHQLRVHMAYIGTPIHGDRVYGKPAERLLLHAHSLEITIPGSQRKTFVSNIPDDFVKLFSKAKI